MRVTPKSLDLTLNVTQNLLKHARNCSEHSTCYLEKDGQPRGRQLQGQLNAYNPALAKGEIFLRLSLLS